MVISKSTSDNLDYKILQYQQLLNNYLVVQKPVLWNCSIAIYGRIQKIEAKGKLFAKVYSDNGDYIDPLSNDNYAATFSFKVNDIKVEGRQPIADVELIGCVDLNQVYSTTEPRNDSKCSMQVFNILKKYVWKIGNIKEGAKEVLNEYTGVKLPDISNWYIFSINFKIIINTKT